MLFDVVFKSLNCAAAGAAATGSQFGDYVFLPHCCSAAHVRKITIDGWELSTREKGRL